MLDATDRATVLSALVAARDYMAHPVVQRAAIPAGASLQRVQEAISILSPGPRPGWPIQRNGTGAPMADLPDPSADELARLSRAVHALGG